jgi:hypothetical protein
MVNNFKCSSQFVKEFEAFLHFFNFFFITLMNNHENFFDFLVNGFNNFGENAGSAK